MDQRIHIAKGAAYLAAGLVSGFLLLLSAPVLLASFVETPLALFLVMILVVVWLIFLLTASARFRDAVADPTTEEAIAEEPEPNEVVS